MSLNELKPIILYDIPCTTPGRPWSPNTMKTRYCLGYKRLPFTTVWIELPDIAGLLQSKGVTNPPYTLPAIEDPNAGGKFIVDSLVIAEYLDEAYPETPKVLGPAVRAMMEKVWDVFSFGSGEAPTDAFGPRLVFLVLAGERLNPVSKDYYYRTRVARFGEGWTALVDACSAGGETRAECVKQGIETIGGVAGKLIEMYRGRQRVSDSESGGRTSGGVSFALGGEPYFLDFAVAGRIKFGLDALDPADAETLTSLHGGRVGKLVKNLERYYEH